MRKKCFWVLAKLRRLQDVRPLVTKRNIQLQCSSTSYFTSTTVWWFGRSVQKKSQQQVEQIQNYAMRLILSRPPRTISAELQKTLHWLATTNRETKSVTISSSVSIRTWARARIHERFLEDVAMMTSMQADCKIILRYDDITTGRHGLIKCVWNVITADQYFSVHHYFCGETWTQSRLHTSH